METIEKDILGIFNKKLEDNPKILKEIISEFIEDIGLKNAIDEGLNSGDSSFEEAYKILSE
jgi:hypothetical protein